MIIHFVSILFKRTYPTLLLTFFSILVGSFLFGAAVSLSGSIKEYFVQEGRTLVGGDVILSSANPIALDSPILQTIKNKGGVISTEYSVQVVFKSGTSSSTSVAALRVVDDVFPMYGEVLVEPGVFALSKNGLYVEQVFLDRITARVGDTVILGSSTFRVLGVLLKEPDAVSLGVSFAPKVIVARDDFNETGIDLTQSRATYKVKIQDTTGSVLSESQRTDLKTYAKDLKIRFDDARNGPDAYIRGLSSVQRFSGIVLAIALFLVVINIVANLTYLVARFRKVVALLKTFGATTTQIQAIYSILLGGIGFVAGAVGSCIGVIVSNASLRYFSTYVEGQINAYAVIPTTALGGLVGLLIIVVSALPFFRSLKNIMPKQLLSHTVDKRSRTTVTAVLLYLPVLFLLSVFLYILSQNWMLIFYSVGGLTITFILFMGISRGIIMLLYVRRDTFSFIVRGSVSSLSFRGVEAVLIISSIMTAFSGVFIVSAIEKNIVTNIQQNISQSAPALYLIDITRSQVETVRKIAGPTFKEYPIIRGRLLMVNDRDMTLSSDRGITREFNMTYRNQLIEKEKIIEGAWHGETNAQKSVSIDKEFADQLGGVKLGDVVTVFIQGLTVKATVTSVRETDRSSGTPFFYLVFSPDSIANFPASYFGTVSATGSEITRIEQEIGQIYQNIIPIQTGRILSTVNALVEVVVFVVKIVSIPSIVLGLILVLVMTGQSLYERKSDVLVFRAFGLTTRSVVWLFIIEIASIVIIAGGVAYALAHLIAYLLNIFLFSFTIFSFTVTPVYLLFGVIAFVSMVAFLIARSLVRTPLKKLLAEK